MPPSSSSTSRLAEPEWVVWLLASAAGQVESCAPGIEQLWGIHPQGLSLARLFGEPLALRLLSAPEDRFEWTRPPQGEEPQPTVWLLSRHRLADGGVLVRAGTRRAVHEEVPAAWERRITRQLAASSGNIAEQQRAFMLAIFDADPTLLFVKDRQGRFIFVNKAMADSFFTTPDELVLARNAEVHRNEQELRLFDEVDQRVISTQSEVHLEESFTRDDGSVEWYETRKRPLRAPSGELFVLGTSVAITERRRMAQLLHETNQRLELAVSAGRLGLWDWDVVRGTVYFSPTWKAQLGYAEHELEDRFDTWRTLLHPEDAQPALLLALRYVSEPELGSHFTNEFRMQARDGSWRWISACGLVVRGDKGQGVRVTGFHVDITELKARQAQQHLLQENLRSTNENLERLSRMKDEFLANMSHELRTPLNAVLGQAEALGEGIFGPVTAQQRVALSTIEQSGQHLLSVINDVLDVAKSSVGQLELDMEPVPVEEVCQESLRLVGEQARRKGLVLSYSREEQAVQVWADRRRLRQVLLNLLSNAQKFTPEGGSVGLSVVARAGGEVAFTVWDTGPGIREQDKPRLFEPFVQLDAGLGRRHEGAGLGLALVRRMVEQHAGWVELDSQVGQGSRFTVVLPPRPTP